MRSDAVRNDEALIFLNAVRNDISKMNERMQSCSDLSVVEGSRGWEAHVLRILHELSGKSFLAFLMTHVVETTKK